MDNLVLTRVAATLDLSVRQSILRDVRDESAHRLRLHFSQGEKHLSLIVSLRPEGPWIGRPLGPWPGPRRPRGSLAATWLRHLRDGVVQGLRKTVDRRVALRFADGHELMIELAGARANLVLIDPRGRIAGWARRPPSAHERLVEGRVYEGPPLPPGRPDPFQAEPEELDREVDRRVAAGSSRREAVLRGWFGLSRSTADLVVRESAQTGRTVGQVAWQRARDVLEGRVDPVVEAPAPPLEAAASGQLRPDDLHLLAWEPAEPARAPLARWRLSDPAATASLYHEAVERGLELQARGQALLSLLNRELVRQRRAAASVAEDIATFDEPERHRKWGEALLAGLDRARRVGEQVWVEDPYDLDRAPMAIPVPPGQSLQAAAGDYFQKYRRARRGLEQARARASELTGRILSLERLRGRAGGGPDQRGLEELEQGMREAGLAIGLEPPTRAGRSAARAPRRRLEGVRLWTTSDGHSVLVGKTGKDNHRLTFRLAAPEDFWFHALGVPGAHVIVRNPERKARPSAATLEEAGAAAAWYSEARAQAQADVQWTRRKHVSKLKGQPPGAVRLKRFETIRVRPRDPEGTRLGMQEARIRPRDGSSGGMG